jgi:hypothetical protein
MKGLKACRANTAQVSTCKTAQRNAMLLHITITMILQRLTRSRSGFFNRIFHCRYLHLHLYSLLFHLSHCVNIYSDWLRKQLCNLSLNTLYVFFVQKKYFLKKGLQYLAYFNRSSKHAERAGWLCFKQKSTYYPKETRSYEQ